VTIDDADVHALERLLARLMLRGVQVSAGFLAVGLALWLSGAAPLHGARLLTAGLFVLMATPLLRVAVSVVEAVRLRDWFFIGTTAAVATLLTISITYALLSRR
jgi:uncharacterized membrane protein